MYINGHKNFVCNSYVVVSKFLNHFFFDFHVYLKTGHPSTVIPGAVGHDARGQ